MPTVAQVRSAWPGLLVFFAKQIVARRSLSQVSGEAFSDVLASAFFQVQSISGVRRFWQELWDAVCQRAIALRSRLRPKDAALFLGLAVKAQKFLADASKPQLSEARFALLSQRHAAAVGVAADSLASHLQNCIHKRRAGEAASGEKGSEEVSTKEAAALSPFLISSAATSCRKLSSLSRHSALHEALASAAVASSFSSFGGFDLTAFVNAAADFPAESTLCLWPVLAPFLFAEIEAFNARAFERLAAAAEALVGAAGRRLHCEGGLSRQVLRLVAISPQRVCRLFVLQQQQFDRRRVNSATLLAALSRVQGFVRRYPELFASLLVGLRTQLLLSAVSLARLALHDGAVCKEGRREEEAELLAFDEALTAGDSLRLVFAADLCDSRDLALICKTLESSQTLQEADRRSAEALEAALSAPILEGVSASLEALSLALYENAFALKLPQGKAETGRLREPLALSLGRQTALVLSCREEDGLKAFRSSLSSLASVLRVVESLALSDAKTASADQLNLAAPLLAELLFRASVCCRRNAAEELNAFLAGEFFSFLSSLLLVARRRRESAFSEAALLAAESVLEVLSSNSAEFLAETPPSLLAVYARALWGASSFVNVCFRVEEADALRMRGVEGEPDGLLLSRSLRRRVARLAEAVALRAVEALGVCEKKDLQETPPPSQQHAPQLAALACSLAVLQSPAAAHAVAAIAAEFARRGELRLSASQTICLLEAFARLVLSPCHAPRAGSWRCWSAGASRALSVSVAQSPTSRRAPLGSSLQTSRRRVPSPSAFCDGGFSDVKGGVLFELPGVHAPSNPSSSAGLLAPLRRGSPGRLSEFLFSHDAGAAAPF